MRAEVRAAVVQMDVVPLDPTQNVARMISFMEDATGRGAELIVFPELATTGYVRERDKDFGRQLYEHSELVPGPATDELGNAAKKDSCFVLFGMSRRHASIPGVLYNSAVLIDSDGSVAGVQDKLHMPGEEKHYFAEGSGVQVFDTDLGRLSCAICYDLRFPEVSRLAALRGAEIQCAIINGITHATQKRSYADDRFKHWAITRACENQNFVLACNRIGTQDGQKFSGNSAVVDPSGAILAHSTSALDEALLIADLVEHELIEERIFKPVFADRRPTLYGDIVEGLA